MFFRPVSHIDNTEQINKVARRQGKGPVQYVPSSVYKLTCEDSRSQILFQTITDNMETVANEIICFAATLALVSLSI